jgi:hypothetical protein
VGKERKDIDGSVGKKAREQNMKLSKHKGKQLQSKDRKYNSKESTYVGKGVVTTERFHTARRRDFVILAQ